MSFCRVSSDDFRCDVYVYESCGGGFMTHVAANKARGWIPRTIQFPYKGRFLKLRGWLWRKTHNLQSWYLQIAPRKPLGLAHDGKTFTDSTATDCADRLEHLRALGYRVPQYAIEALREVAAEKEK